MRYFNEEYYYFYRDYYSRVNQDIDRDMNYSGWCARDLGTVIEPFLNAEPEVNFNICYDSVGIFHFNLQRSRLHAEIHFEENRAATCLVCRKDGRIHLRVK